MTISVDTAGVIAQIVPVGLLILAIESRFVRSWSRTRGQLALRMILTVAGSVVLIAGTVTEVALVQAVLFETPIEGAMGEFIRWALFGMGCGVSAYLGGSLVANAGIGTTHD